MKMFKVTQSWQMPVNLLVVAVFLLCIARGWKRGLFRSLLSLFSMFLSLWLAWNTKEIFSDRFSILPEQWMTQTKFPGIDFLDTFFNRILWFLILFVIFRILFFVLDRVLKRLHSVKGIRQISGVLGGIFGGIQAFVWCLLFCVVLRTPLFRNGSLAVNGTALGFIYDAAVNTVGHIDDPSIIAKTFSISQKDLGQRTSEEKEHIEKWLDENGYDQKGETEK